MYFWLCCGSVTEMGIRYVIIALFALVWLAPAKGYAHPMLDRAVDAYERAEFEKALRTFDAAARNADLSVEELLRLFEMRALVYHALGDEAAMRADLGRLVAVRGSYQLSRLAPPTVRAVFDEIRETGTGENGVELRIEETSIESEPWVVARVLRVPEDLVDHTTLQCSIDSNSRTVSRTSRGNSTSLKLPESGGHNGCTATARTRNGGVLFRASVEGASPLMPSTTSKRFAMPKYKKRDDGGKAKKKKWPWIVAVSAAVVVGGVTAGVVVSQRSKNDDQAQAGAVTVAW